MNGRRSRALKRSLALAMTAKPGALAMGLVPHAAAAAATTNVVCDPTGAALVTAISSAAPGDTLSLAAGCVYDLAAANTPGEGLPVINQTLVIQGNGATITRDNAASDFRILHVGAQGNLSVDHVTISNGVAVTSGFGSPALGGGILNDGALTLTSSTISGNKATSSFVAKGGGLANSGTATVSNSTISGNTATFAGGGGPGGTAAGGGIATTGGTLTVSNSTLSQNHATATVSGEGSNGTARGGGIAIKGGNPIDDGNAVGPSATITGSTLSANTATATAGVDGTATATGGAIEDRNSSSAQSSLVTTVKLANDTITGNSTSNITTPGTSSGGGINMSSKTGDTLTVVNNTIANNTSTDSGIHQTGAGTATIANTILASNPGGNCNGTLADGGHNLSFPASDATCGTFGAGDPVLGALASNGGLTQTMALGTGSAAIDAADGAICAAALPGGAGGIDQRGLPRAEVAGDTTCDVGAYEVQPVPAAAAAPAAVVPALPKAGRPGTVPDLPLAPIGAAVAAATAAGIGRLRRLRSKT